MAKKTPMSGKIIMQQLFDFYNSPEITDEQKQILNVFYDKYRGKKRIPDTEIKKVLQDLQQTTKEIIKQPKEEKISTVMKVPIPKSILSDKAQTLYKHIASDTLYISSSELKNLENIQNREYNLAKNKFQVKDKEEYDIALQQFQEKLEAGKFNIAEQRAKELIAIRPEMSDSLYQVIEKKKKEPRYPVYDWLKSWVK